MTEAGTDRPLGWRRAVPILLALLIGAVYAPTLDDDFVVWDDDDHIYENRHIVAEDGYAEAWREWRDPAFYPITFTSWYVEWRLADGQPWLFQLDNILLHIACALVLGLLLRALGLPHGLAWAITGVWALHPTQVASVAWLTERKNLLYALFYFASLLTYVRAVSRDGTVATSGFLAALLLALASLLSKATAVTLPVAIAVAHWVRGGRFDRAAATKLSTFFALSITIGLLHVSREEVTPLLPFGDRMLIAARAAWFYVGNFLWPDHLVAVYPRWSLDGAPWWGSASLVALAGAAALGLWKARRIPPVAWWGVTMYAANIGLVVGVLWFPFMGYSFVSDHLTYVPAVGLAVVFGLAANALLDRVRSTRGVRVGITTATWLVLAFLSWQQTAHWENTEELWTQTLAANPESRLAHKNLGTFFMDQGRMDEAQHHFEATLALNPDDVEATLNLGVLASNRGDWELATRLLQTTLARGAYASIALNNLGIVSQRRGRLAEAISYYERALELDPGDANTWLNVGAARVALGDPERALSDYEEALRRNPRSAAAHYNRAIALHGLDRPEDAARAYERARALSPDDADTLYNLGVVRMELGQYDDAAECFTGTLAIAPGYADAAHNLGAVLLAERKLGPAEEAFERAYALAPGDADTASVLARLVAHRGDLEHAAEILEKARASNPDDPRLTAQLTELRRVTKTATAGSDPAPAEPRAR